ncbi:hypothetical protein BBJ28_00014585 [Nothophytophthora sp. Chile5]|nr:hypothetical protein BBJ28_00014585 [Nothophytophthora sp. Chile5]
MLINYGADVNAKNNEGRTPLMVVAYMGREEIVKLLLANSVNVELKDNLGRTAFAIARSNRKNVVAELIAEGPAPPVKRQRTR